LRGKEANYFLRPSCLKVILLGVSAVGLAEACFLHVAPLIKTQITHTTSQAKGRGGKDWRSESLRVQAKNREELRELLGCVTSCRDLARGQCSSAFFFFFFFLMLLQRVSWPEKQETGYQAGLRQDSLSLCDLGYVALSRPHFLVYKIRGLDLAPRLLGLCMRRYQGTKGK
jgi:hypothetical protein